MSKLHCLGMALPEVIAAATMRPAAALRRPDLGTLAPGAAGDAVVLDLVEGSFDYVDVMGEHITGGQRLEVRHVIVGGALWHTRLRRPEVRAAPAPPAAAVAAFRKRFAARRTFDRAAQVVDTARAGRRCGRACGRDECRVCDLR